MIEIAIVLGSLYAGYRLFRKDGESLFIKIQNEV